MLNPRNSLSRNTISFDQLSSINPGMDNELISRMVDLPVNYTIHSDPPPRSVKEGGATRFMNGINYWQPAIP